MLVSIPTPSTYIHILSNHILNTRQTNKSNYHAQNHHKRPSVYKLPDTHTFKNTNNTKLSANTKITTSKNKYKP